ncbi:MAG: methyltransferase domain-containing protein [Verrucomicrobia bacterium]|nr:methyltransferase domain-containing protein [Verrucomicrobiota bacterium]
MNDDVKRHFDVMASAGEWQDRYGKKDDWESYNYLTRKEHVFKLFAGQEITSVLDIGCGSGDYMDLAPTFSCRYTGVDFSEKMIGAAKEKAARQGVENVDFRMGDASGLAFDDASFDAVMGIGLIEYLEDPVPMLKEIHRVLKPGGKLIMQAYQFTWYDITQKVYFALLRRKPGGVLHRRYSRKTLNRLLAENGFEAEDYRYCNFRFMPVTFEWRLPKLYVGSSEFISKYFPRSFSWFAANYIGRYHTR